MRKSPFVNVNEEHCIFVLLMMKSCFLLLVRAFDKNALLKNSKEKKATSLKIKQNMPKISENSPQK